MRFLFIDRIVELLPGVSAKGIKHVTRDDHYLCQDKDHAWCFVPALIGETLGQLAAWNVMMQHDFQLRPVAGIAACASFYRSAYVGDTLVLNAHIDAVDSAVVQYHGEVHVNDELVFRLDGALGPMLPMVDFIDPAVARRQFDEIYRPCTVVSHDEMHDPVDALISLDQHTFVPRCGSKMVFDRVIEHQPNVSMTAVKHVTRAASYFVDHFPHKPVLPMTILLECFVNLADAFLMQSGRQGMYLCQKVSRIKMSDFISPGDVVMGTVTIKHETDRDVVFVGRASVSGKRVGVLEITMTLKG